MVRVRPLIIAEEPSKSLPVNIAHGSVPATIEIVTAPGLRRRHGIKGKGSRSSFGTTVFRYSDRQYPLKDVETLSDFVERCSSRGCVCELLDVKDLPEGTRHVYKVRRLKDLVPSFFEVTELKDKA